jgi:putative flippase GtrA
MKQGKFDRIITSFFSVQFLKFLLVGGTAALINFLSGLLMREYLIPQFPEVSVGIANIIGAIVSFIFNKIFTFKAADEKTGIQALKFALVAVTASFIAMGISWVVLFVYKSSGITSIDSKMAGHASQVIAIGITTIYNFIAMKFFSFRKITGKQSQEIPTVDKGHF